MIWKQINSKVVKYAVDTEGTTEGSKNRAGWGNLHPASQSWVHRQVKFNVENHNVNMEKNPVLTCKTI